MYWTQWLTFSFRYLRVERNDSPNTILNYKDDLIAFSRVFVRSGESYLA